MYGVRTRCGADGSRSQSRRPVTQAPSFVPLDTSAPLKLLSAAAGTGMGTYDYTPAFRLMLPATASPGAYAASVVVSINTGP